MQYSFIIHTDAGFGVKWKELHNPTFHKLIVFVTPQILKSIKPEDKIYIDRLVELPNKEFQTVLQKIEESLKEFNVDDYTNIRLASCDELSLRLVALIREQLNIPGNTFKQVEAFTNKILMKERIRPSVRVPKFIPFEQKKMAHKEDYLKEIGNHLGFPIIGKPVDSAGSDRITKIHNPEELISWCNEFSQYNNFELEEFIDGELYQCDSIIVAGKILHMQVCKYNTPVANFIKGSPLGSIVIPSENKVAQKLMQFNEKALLAFGHLPSGVTHMEIFIDNKNQECVFLECAGRAPGAYTCPAYDIYLGIHHETLQVKIELGLPYEIPKSYGDFSAWVWYPNKEGEVINIQDPESICEHKFTRMHKNGEVIKKPTIQRERAAAILFWNASYEKLTKEFDRLCKLDIVYTKEPTLLLQTVFNFYQQSNTVQNHQTQTSQQEQGSTLINTI